MFFKNIRKCFFGNKKKSFISFFIFLLWNIFVWFLSMYATSVYEDKFPNNSLLKIDKNMDKITDNMNVEFVKRKKEMITLERKLDSYYNQIQFYSHVDNNNNYCLSKSELELRQKEFKDLSVILKKEINKLTDSIKEKKELSVKLKKEINNLRAK